MKLGSRIILSALLSLTLMGCAGLATPEPERPPLRFAYSSWPGELSVILAQQKGYFAKAGVEVTPLFYDNYAHAMADFLGGKYDSMGVQLGDAVTLAQRDPAIRAVLVTDLSVGAEGVVAGKGIRQVTDLGGARIGVDIGTTGELFVIQMLETVGLSLGDVTLVEMDPSEAAARLSSGDVDAAYTWDPFLSEALLGGGQLIFSSPDLEGLFPNVLVFQGAILETRPQDVRGFVQGWFEAVNDRLADPEGANQVVAATLDLTVQDVAAGGMHLLTLNENEALFTTGDGLESLHYTGRLYADFYMTGGLMTRPTDIDLLLDPSFLK